MMITKAGRGDQGGGRHPQQRGSKTSSPDCWLVCRDASPRSSIQKSFYVSSACLAAWHFLALLPSAGRVACNAWLRCRPLLPNPPPSPSHPILPHRSAGESMLLLAISFRRAAKTHETETFAKYVKRNAVRPILGFGFSSRSTIQSARPSVSFCPFVCLSACLVHPSVCLSQSQSESQAAV